MAGSPPLALRSPLLLHPSLLLLAAATSADPLSPIFSGLMFGNSQVYKGVLADGEVVAIKRAQTGSLQGTVKFKTGIELLSRIPSNPTDPIRQLKKFEDKERRGVVKMNGERWKEIQIPVEKVKSVGRSRETKVVPFVRV
ncbi:hypothetical protein Drorol1_Dr00013872 [Drosera rotundifolia]